MELYPFQQRLFDRWELIKAPRREILSWPTGAGKTYAGLRVARDYQKVFICAAQSALAVWDAESRRFFDEPIGLLTKGPRKYVSKKEAKRLEEAWTCRVIGSTPALWEKLFRPTGDRCLLLIDEAHMFDAPDVGRSLALRQWIGGCPRMDVLALTATFVRKEVQDVWNLGNTLHPEIITGKLTERNRVPFGFLARYCRRDPELGFFFGANPETLPELRERLSNFTDFVSGDEVLAVAPPLQLRFVRMEPGEALKWVAEQECESLAVLTQHRAQAKSLHASLGGTYLDGTIDGLKRAKELEVLREAYRKQEACRLVGTFGCVLESISLAFIEQALILEFPRSPGQLLQLLGRFRRPDPDKRVPSIVTIACGAAEFDKLQTAYERLAALETVQGSSGNSETALAGASSLLNRTLSASEVEKMMSADPLAELAELLDGEELDYDDF